MIKNVQFVMKIVGFVQGQGISNAKNVTQTTIWDLILKLPYVLIPVPKANMETLLLTPVLFAIFNAKFVITQEIIIALNVKTEIIQV